MDVGAVAVPGYRLDGAFSRGLPYCVAWLSSAYRAGLTVNMFTVSSLEKVCFKSSGDWMGGAVSPKKEVLV